MNNYSKGLRKSKPKAPALVALDTGRATHYMVINYLQMACGGESTKGHGVEADIGIRFGMDVVSTVKMPAGKTSHAPSLRLYELMVNAVSYFRCGHPH